MNLHKLINEKKQEEEREILEGTYQYTFVYELFFNQHMHIDKSI